MTFSQIWLARFSKITSLSTLFLIFLGGRVTSHQAGLSVPDWPTTYGQNMFLFPYSDWVGNIFHEHLHRLVASGVGFLTLLLMIWVLKTEERRGVRILSVLAFIGVVLQGLLGGLTVKCLLPTSVSVAHAMLAQTFFLLTVVLAHALSSEGHSEVKEETLIPRSFFVLSLLLFCSIYFQLFLGAVMRHTESALAIPDFPKTMGQWLPHLNASVLEKINLWRFDHDLDPVVMKQVIIHLAHRFGALLVVGLMGFLCYWAYKIALSTPRVLHCLYALPALLGVQIVLGAGVVWSQKTPLVASLHVVTGAALLALSVFLILRIRMNLEK